jgi:hypothetical protein
VAFNVVCPPSVTVFGVAVTLRVPVGGCTIVVVGGVSVVVGGCIVVGVVGVVGATIVTVVVGIVGGIVGAAEVDVTLTVVVGALGTAKVAFADDVVSRPSSKRWNTASMSAGGSTQISVGSVAMADPLTSTEPRGFPAAAKSTRPLPTSPETESVTGVPATPDEGVSVSEIGVAATEARPDVCDTATGIATAIKVTARNTPVSFCLERCPRRKSVIRLT